MINSLTELFQIGQAELEPTPYKGICFNINSRLSARGANNFRLGKRFILKTHMNYYQFKRNDCPEVKIIYMLRDARDVMVSEYFYIYGFLKKNKYKVENFNNIDFEKFIDKRLDEYKTHIVSWLEYAEKRPLNIIIIKYEEFKRYYINILKKISDFINWPVCIDYDIVKKHNVIDYEKNVFKGDNTAFYRKGIIGDWKNYLTEKHKNQINNKCYDVMNKLGYFKTKDW